MNSHVLSGGTKSFKILHLHRFYHIGKAASVNTAIERVLRKHQPLKPSRGDQKPASRSWEASSTEKRYGSPRPRTGSSNYPNTRAETRTPRESFNPLNRTSRFRSQEQSSKFDGSSREHYPEKSSRYTERPREAARYGKSSTAFKNRAPRDNRFESSSTLDDRSLHKPQGPSFSRSSNVRESIASASTHYPSLSPQGRIYRPRNFEGYPGDSGRADTRQYKKADHHGRNSVHPSGRTVDSRHGESTESRESFSDGNKPPASGVSSEFPRRNSHRPFDRTHSTAFSDKLPVSVPYTTPASEFLYGTSVVEAALRSQRSPRRKLYKLYIYTGENREGGERDKQLERLAKRNGVDVVRVGNEGLRLMEKLSSGRPHNGYILEASPLPRLPVQSLGEHTTREGQAGFLVTIGHQSREEAAVNGVSDFLPSPSSGKMPFVLLLDGIVDPGNMGGILRTAGFLGVSAVAISTRNSAPFTPVVLKASAGASENVTLFSVSAPAGFVVESQRAGWKLFAGVAPSPSKDTAVPGSTSTDDLGDPLSESPCILMLGSEGEGLRWNLRSKADHEVHIQGCGESHNVDSLNVSVAAGILCGAFLRGKSNSNGPSLGKEREADGISAPAKDLF